MYCLVLFIQTVFLSVQPKVKLEQEWFIFPLTANEQTRSKVRKVC